MKAAELRIGNYVQHDGMPIIVQNLVKADFWHIRNGDNYCVIALEDLKPIPLTPELLKKCFLYENGIYKTEKLRGFFLRLQLDDVMFAEYNFGFHSICKVKYLHQLQNLYYALTGEELEVKFKTTIRK